MLTHLDVPKKFNRNHPSIRKAGFEHTGKVLIELAGERCGFETLADKDILDVGCGFRFTVSIINKGIPIRSYTGVEVYRPVVEFLADNVAAEDQRFRYFHWDVRNALYNPDTEQTISDAPALPVDGSYDCIWLFSVFTHLDPEDSRALLGALRGCLRPGGRLFFSAFIDEDLEKFEDRVPEKPLLMAYYGGVYMRSLLAETGWTVESEYEADPDRYVQHQFVCSAGVPD